MSAIQKIMHKYQEDGIWSTLYSTYSKVHQEAKYRTLRPKLFHIITTLRYKKNKQLYAAPANPYKIINIKISRMKLFNEEIDNLWGLGVIKGGGWDSQENCHQICSTTHYEGFKQRFKKGYDWSDTVYYDKRKEALTEKRLEYIDNLYRNMKKDGYRPNHEAEHDASGDRRQGKVRHIHALEPLVSIGREGEIYLSEGFHRVAMAKLLNINSIPANVLARHKKWQRVRDDLYKETDPEDQLQLSDHTVHPDLNDVV